MVTRANVWTNNEISGKGHSWAFMEGVRLMAGVIVTSNTGFELVDPRPATGKLMVSSKGHEKRGKTTFALSMPAPLAVISLDTGTKAMAEKERRKGRTIYLSQYSKITDNDGHEANKKKWASVKRDLEWAKKTKSIRSLAIDTGSSFYELARLAEFGKLEQVPPFKYTGLNQDLDDLIIDLYESHLNVTWCHFLKKEYSGKDVIEKGTKVTKEIWTGGYKFSGYSKLPLHCHVNLLHEKDIDESGQTYLYAQIDGVPREGGPDYAEYRLQGDELNFAFLGQLLMPDSSPKDWEDSK